MEKGAADVKCKEMKRLDRGDMETWSYICCQLTRDAEWHCLLSQSYTKWIESFLAESKRAILWTGDRSKLTGNNKIQSTSEEKCILFPPIWKTCMGTHIHTQNTQCIQIHTHACMHTHTISNKYIILFQSVKCYHLSHTEDGYSGCMELFPIAHSSLMDECSKSKS